jgi:hypothetical protein
MSKSKFFVLVNRRRKAKVPYFSVHVLLMSDQVAIWPVWFVDGGRGIVMSGLSESILIESIPGALSGLIDEAFLSVKYAPLFEMDSINGPSSFVSSSVERKQARQVFIYTEDPDRGIAKINTFDKERKSASITAEYPISDKTEAREFLANLLVLPSS